MAFYFRAEFSSLSSITSPTCADLGIPRDPGDVSRRRSDDDDENLPDDDAQSKNGLFYDSTNPNNPFSPGSIIPLPSSHPACDYSAEPAFIRKRNERERERVRCVNEGYLRLRQHLPLDRKDKRVSKVETLRCAIRYIQQLQETLQQSEENRKVATGPKYNKVKTHSTD